jgi:hypothetical protein
MDRNYSYMYICNQQLHTTVTLRTVIFLKQTPTCFEPYWSINRNYINCCCIEQLLNNTLMSCILPDGEKQNPKHVGAHCFKMLLWIEWQLCVLVGKICIKWITMHCMENIRLKLKWRNLHRINISEAKVLVTNTPKLFFSTTSAHSDTNVKDSKKNHK